FTSPAGALGEMVSYVFGKPAETVSKEELAKIQWLETKGDIDNLWIGWSFDAPETEGAELTWVPLPRDMALGKESLYLFTGLKKLSINQLIDAEDIKGLKLESIGGYFGTPAEAAAALEDTGLIKELRFNAGADTLEGLGDFAELETLYVEYCELEDLKPVVQLPKLKRLTFEGLPEINDFSVLGAMENLVELSLQAENLKTLDFLKGLKNLQSLTIVDGSMISLEGLEALPQLTALTIGGCGELRDMEAVTGLENLKELSLELAYDCPEPDLSKMGQLEKLSLTYFEDCSFVGNLTELRELRLEGCTIPSGVDLSGLAKLKSLTCHYFVSTGQDLSFAAKFPALEKLDLQGMATYDDISWAFNSGTIKELNISGMECEINFDLIGENQVMEKLFMDGMVLYNNVQVSGDGGIVYVDWDDVDLKKHMDFLGKLKGLKTLSIAENELTDLEFAKDLGALETLDISENYITDLKPLAGLKALKSVNCSGNPVSNDRTLGDKVLLINE
ncbi:MAG: leucine-rich repeat domain-containing protein, partial [Clostridium sp.]|nr:leucine-rich repeat domain-containing protein [Clostridium sp.]